jgi:Uma2 family endonuclease
MSEALDWGDPGERMDRATYLAWAQAHSGRYERWDGIVVSMAPERLDHARTKASVLGTLRPTIRAAGLPCEAIPDGITVEVGDSDYEPDGMVRCGAPLPGYVTTVTDPVIIVEVLSPSTARTDRTMKLRDYFLLPSVRHYLLVRPDRAHVVHHCRDDDGGITERIMSTGLLSLDPPGLAVRIEEFYAPSG